MRFDIISLALFITLINTQFSNNNINPSLNPQLAPSPRLSPQNISPILIDDEPTSTRNKFPVTTSIRASTGFGDIRSTMEFTSTRTPNGTKTVSTSSRSNMSSSTSSSTDPKSTTSKAFTNVSVKTYSSTSNGLKLQAGYLSCFLVGIGLGIFYY
ncbi:hypothetical protein K502DRAFT_339752 [Neoconidiobolus thromboides FSU 785]|nr:hypothetical protein K502DRAFT_339752 [Neoconidiobolus thromboides FSU 785]